MLALPLTFALVRLDYELRWYIVTDRSLRIREGVTSLRESTMTFANIQHIAVRQGPLQPIPQHAHRGRLVLDQIPLGCDDDHCPALFDRLRGNAEILPLQHRRGVEGHGNDMSKPDRPQTVAGR